MSYSRFDEKVARTLQDQLNCTGITENAVIPKEKEKENYRPRTLIDETLEYIDPTPNIFTLFVQFNQKFFWNVLLPVQVRWSPRMTSCAGICTFHPRNKECIIALSTPLLKLRPRKDLVETLLHEMIHAYLFLTNDNRDRDGHGPVFQSHMHRINKIAGTKITIYHTFHEEVKLYQQHWWRCNGPCQKKGPYFGMVKRAMNRAPGPNDFWWTEHQATCGGQYIKIKEPEKPEKKKTETKNRKSITAVSRPPEKNNLLGWVKKTGANSDLKQDMNGVKQPNQSKIPNRTPNNITKNPVSPQITSMSNKRNSIPNIQTDLKKLGNSTNNVHGWGTGGPGSISSSNNKFNTKVGSSNSIPKSTQPYLSFSGTLGGKGTGRSILLDKFSNPSTSNINQINSDRIPAFKKAFENPGASNSVQKKTVNCPNCQKSVEEAMINEHLDKCLESTDEPTSVNITSNNKRKSEIDYLTKNKIFKKESTSSSSDIECPLCSKKIKSDFFNQHLDGCNSVIELSDDDVVSVHDSSSSSVKLQDSPHVCLICDKVLEPPLTLNEHLEDCVSSVFNDSEDDSIIEKFKSDEQDEKEEKDEIGKYPCPACMTLVEESLMNAHLDTCLK